MNEIKPSRAGAGVMLPERCTDCGAEGVVLHRTFAPALLCDDCIYQRLDDGALLDEIDYSDAEDA